MSDNFEPYLKNIDDLKGFNKISKLLTLIERNGIKSLPFLNNIKPFSFRFGITGPPGVGKSSLTGDLISDLSKKFNKVGILAMDPSSPFSQGAILGDRIRYQEKLIDLENVFMRSVSSRGSLGGINLNVCLMLKAFDLYKFDFVLVETVGVGQTELDIMKVVDKVALVLSPEYGDSIQTIKSGILEIADIFLINKIDLGLSSSLKNDLEEFKKPIFEVSSKTKKGLKEVSKYFVNYNKPSSRKQSKEYEISLYVDAALEKNKKEVIKKLSKEKKMISKLSKLRMKY